MAAGSPNLTIAVGETGPVPDHQCALKDAILVAASANITNADEIAAMARTFHALLQELGGAAAPAAAAAPAPAQPAQPDPNAGQPAPDPNAQPQPGTQQNPDPAQPAQQ
jgi:hypothetical protein